MKTIELSDLKALSLAVKFLGSGGGGDSEYAYMIAHSALQKTANISLMDISQVPDDAVVIPIAFAGRPDVLKEAIPSGKELLACIKEVMKNYPKNTFFILMCCEIGGLNGLVPLICAAQLGLPLLDGDFMGRAFPCLHMSSPALANVPATPCYISNSVGQCSVIREPLTPQELENHIRDKIVPQEGGNVAMALYLMKGAVAKKAILPGTITQALSLGESILSREPTESIFQCLKNIYPNVQSFGFAIVIKNTPVINSGFFEGIFELKNEGLEEAYFMFYKNEFLSLEYKGDLLACTPHLLVLLERESGTPLNSDLVQVGMEVEILVIPPHPVWLSPEGLKIVGLQAFQTEKNK